MQKPPENLNEPITMPVAGYSATAAIFFGLWKDNLAAGVFMFFTFFAFLMAACEIERELEKLNLK